MGVESWEISSFLQVQFNRGRIGFFKKVVAYFLIIAVVGGDDYKDLRLQILRGLGDGFIAVPYLHEILR